MQIEFISPSILKHFERNPRRISKEQFEKLCNNIKADPDFFNARPLLVNKIGKDHIVYAGNQRLRAAHKLKLDKVPCVIASDLPESLMKKRLVLDNITHGEFDYDLLASEFDMNELLELGMQEKDLEIFNIQDIEPEAEDESELFEPCKDEDAITKLGDIYELNRHRLVCGDSTNPDVVSKCLNGAEPILMVTDPPYGVEYDPSWRKDIKGKHGVAKALGKVQNDDRINWALAWHLFPGSVAYIWHAGKYCGEVEKSLNEAEFEIISQIVWVKQHFALSRGDYHWQHEPCWYVCRKGHKHNWQGARDQATTWDISNLNCFGKSKEEGEERTAHSTQKPIECMARPIRNNTAQGEGVYDCFMGSGTTLIAAEQLNRICYGIELSPAYCDIIVDRWKKFMIKSNKEYTIKRNEEIQNG